MRLISEATKKNIEGGSFIRRMFEAGISLKKQYGEDAVCDFSLGNPDLPPPPAVVQGLRDFAEKAGKPFGLGYMPNGGFGFAREALAKHISKEQGLTLTADDVVLTSGAAGGLNCFLKSVLEPGEELLSPAPYFVEYGVYAANHGGAFRTVPTKEDFSLDIEAFEKAIGPKTRAIIINSPNNPTGQVYSAEELKALTDMLSKKNEGKDRPIFLISDEPYRFLTYDGAKVSPILPMYPYSVVASSFSKNLSMPGERIGYLAVSPLMEGRQELVSGFILANRILGFVNPPVIGQHLMMYALDAQVDASIYVKRKEAMAEVLTAAGYEFTMPKGAFYFFPKAPGGNDVAFTDRLREHLVLAVPGTGFGGPGYFRMAFCVDVKIIHRAAEGLKKAIR